MPVGIEYLGDDYKMVLLSFPLYYMKIDEAKSLVNTVVHDKFGETVGINEAILDAGMNRNVKNSRIYAALKGAIDSGLKVPHNEKVLPPMESIKSEKMSKIFDKIIKEKTE